MAKLMVKNKMMFFVTVALAALFMMISIAPQAHATEHEDITPPDDVENVEATPYDSAILLSWDVATDDTAVTGYKIYSGPEEVTVDSGEYSNDVIDAGDVIEYLIEGLDNGEPVYFAVTAYDAAGNESENYSVEVSATPDELYGAAPSEHMAADEEPPTVADAEAVDNETVKVEFSEAVVLPSEDTELAFSVVNNATSETLSVLAVSMDPDDVSGQTVLLTTDPQEAGAEYILTAGIQIEDAAGNPIVSGTSDTAAFLGSSVEPGSDLTGDLPENDMVAPSVVSAKSTGKTGVKVTFSEEVTLNADPTDNFFITESDDANNILDIVGVDVSSNGKVVDIETSDQASLNYTLIVIGVMDTAGNEIDDAANSASFDGNEGGIVPPADTLGDAVIKEVKNFLAEMVSDMVVKLTWDAVEDSTITDQILYRSTDGGDTYDGGTSLGPDRAEVELTGLQPGLEYFFKLTTMNEEGEESDGVVTSIRLPETGMGLGLLAGASFGIAAIRNRKKK